jgi:hypothetical protein
LIALFRKKISKLAGVWDSRFESTSSIYARDICGLSNPNVYISNASAADASTSLKSFSEGDKVSRNDFKSASNLQACSTKSDFAMNHGHGNLYKSFEVIVLSLAAISPDIRSVPLKEI